MDGYIRWFDDIKMQDLPLVGGKNASLGEMYQTLSLQGIKIPRGFAITADAFSALIEENNLKNKIYPMLAKLDGNNTEELARVGQKVRSLVRSSKVPIAVQKEIKNAYAELSRFVKMQDVDVAVRSSATAEDLPTASFAGQQETFLNIRGEDDLLNSCRNCFASLFTDRAISYRMTNGFAHDKVRLSIGVQQMVRSDLASSGVMFSIDTESGANNVVLINSSYGLGENIVGGKVDPDEFIVSKPLLDTDFIPILRRKTGSKKMKMIYSGQGTRSTKNIEVSLTDQKKLSLNDEDVIQLSSWALKIENYYTKLNKHYTPMDIEWAKDGRNGELFILQARPETIHAVRAKAKAETYVLDKKDTKAELLLTGRAVGTKIGSGVVKIIHRPSDFSQFQEGNVLVAETTDPDWEPIMKKASAIVTNRGGRTCHAAIIGREHGVPCIVGTEIATDKLKDGQQITVSCAEGDDGYVYNGVVPFHTEKINWAELAHTKTKVMVNLGNPAQALKISLLPAAGVGLVRMEFIISEMIKVHPMALVHLIKMTDTKLRSDIDELLGPYRENPEQYFIDKLSEGIGLIAGAFYPRPVIVRFSDFKTNEYAHLMGGELFESTEENPMLGFRGASRYYHENYRDGFALECMAIKNLRERMGLKNIKVMVPFCRSPEEGEKVEAEMKKHGLIRGMDGLEIYVMSEIPTNVLRADEFARAFDGFSIGSNDLTQLVLGVDRDSSIISGLFNERDPSVLLMLKMAISSAKKNNRPIGICGQAPSDYPEFSEFLVKEGIDSISVTADAFAKTVKTVLEVEKSLGITPFVSVEVQ